MPELSRRPYLLRAMYEWIVDSGRTPVRPMAACGTTVCMPPSALGVPLKMPLAAPLIEIESAALAEAAPPLGAPGQ